MILGLRHQSWTEFALEQHSWILSVLQTFFPAEEYLAQLELPRASEQTDSGNRDVSTEACPWGALSSVLPSTLCYGFILSLIRQTASIGAESLARMRAHLEA